MVIPPVRCCAIVIVTLATLSVPLAAIPTEPPTPATETPAPAPEAQPSPPASPFPSPNGLRDQVDFWKNVFATWSLGQVVLHDADHPQLIYEILTVPGDPDEGFTRSQRDYVRRHRATLEARIGHLEKKVKAREPLSDEEKALALQIVTMAGTDAIRGASERVHAQRGLRERFRRGLEFSGRFDASFRAVFREAGLPEDLALLPHVESSFQAAARSSAGAVGIWQFTRSAGRRFLALNSAIDERLDPVAAARGAARYLGAAYGMLGDWALAITSYNHGVEGMLRAKERFGTDFDRIVREYDGKLFGFASKNFYAEFLAVREIVAERERYFPEGLATESPLDLDRVVIEQRMPPIQVSRAYGVGFGDLVSINPAWTRRAVRGGAAIPAGTTVWLPGGTLARLESKRDAAPPPSPVSPPGAPARAPTAQSAAEKHGQAAALVTEVVVHVVRRGESLFQIAMRYGVTVSDLLGLNRLTEHSVLRPGQRLRVPVKP